MQLCSEIGTAAWDQDTVILELKLRRSFSTDYWYQMISDGVDDIKQRLRVFSHLTIGFLRLGVRPAEPTEGICIEYQEKRKCNH